MANRSITLSLTARVAGLVSGLRQAQQETDKTASRWSGMQDKIQKSSGQINAVGNRFMAAGAVVTAGVGLMVKSYADFDKQMSSVSAATHASAQDMEALRAKAIEVGADTAFSAKEAGQGIEELAKAGVSTSDILGGALKGSMDLAAAGGLDVGEAAETAASAMTQFKLQGKDVPHIADLLAAGAGKAQGSVHDLGQALNQSGIVASQTGLSIEETTGGLAAFASAGLTGSDAGTSFKTMLQRLTPQSTAAQKQFDELGISAYDAQGNFVGLANFAGQLKTSMSGMSAEARNSAMNVMFGSDAVRAAGVLYEQGASGIQEWIDNVNDAGYAAETAARMQDNLAGDIEKLGGSMDSVFLKSGSGMNDFLRNLTQGAEGVVDQIGKIPAPVLNASAAVAGIGGVGLLAAGGLMKVTTSASDTIAAWKNLQSASPKTAGAIKSVGKAATVAVAALAAFETVKTIYNGMQDGAKSVEDYTHALYDLDNVQGSIADKAKSSALVDMFKFDSNVGKGDGALSVFTTHVTNMGDAIDRLNPDLSTFHGKMDGISKLFAGAGLDNQTKQIQDNFKGMDDAMSVAASSGNMETVTESFKVMLKNMEGTGHGLEDLKPLFKETFNAYRGYADELGVSVPDDSIWAWISTGKAPADITKAAAAQKALGEETEATNAVLSQMDAPPGLQDLIDQTQEAANGFLGARDASRGFQEAIDGAEAAIKENGKTLDITTEKGRANQAALDAVGNSALNLAEKAQEPNAKLKALSEGRAEVVRLAQDMGMSASKASKLADDMGLIPSSVYSSVEVQGLDAGEKVKLLAHELNTMPKGKSITIKENSPQVIAGLKALGFKVTRLPDGKIKVTATGTAKAEKDIDAVAKKQRKAEIDVKVKQEKAKSDFDAFKSKMLNGGKSVGWSVKVDADTSKADAKLNSTAKKKRTADIGAKASTGAADSQLSKTASKKRTATVGTKASTGTADSALRALINKTRTAGIGTKADTGTARGQLASLTGHQGTATINVQVAGAIAAAGTIASLAAQAARIKVGHAVGGRVGDLPRRAGGGRLPATGLGTDQILGVSRKDGMPTAWVDDREWVINRRSSDAFDGTLAAINRGDRMSALASLVRGHADGGRVGDLPAFASGGRYRWAGAQVVRASSALSRTKVYDRAADAREKARIKRAKDRAKAEARQTAALEKAKERAEKRRDAAKSKNAKAAARADVKALSYRIKAQKKEEAAAKKAVTAAEKHRDKTSAAYDKKIEKRRDALQAARERKTRLGELEFSTRRTLYRGTMSDQYGAGNYSGVDQLFDLSKNTDLSKYRRKQLSSLAYKQERQVKSLTKQSDKLAASLEKASSKRDELLSARDNIKSSMLGSLDLTSLTGQKDQWGYNQFAGKAGVLSYVKSKAAGAKKLEGLIQKLNKKKIPAALIQDVINEWTSSGTFELANAILSMSAAETKTLISSYSSFDTWSQRVGDRYTDAMAGGGYKSGLYAAQGVVKGLESQQKKVEAAFAKLAKQGEAAYRKALGIKSPSRVMIANSGHTVAGVVKGIQAQTPAAVSAMADLARAQSDAYTTAITTPAYTMPASAEVARYAASQGGSAYVDQRALTAQVTQAVSEALSGWRVEASVDRRTAGRIVQTGGQYVTNNR